MIAATTRQEPVFRSRAVRRGLAALLVSLAASIAVTSAQAGHTAGGDRQAFSERFAKASLVASHWRQWWGTFAIDHGEAVLGSTPPTAAGETHSSLLTTRQTWADFVLDLDVSPVRQLRRNDPPNTWETGWVMFRFRDLENYYFFLLKPNGWELGKKQGSDTQIFLATGGSPRLPIGSRAHLRLVVAGRHIRVSIDGTSVVDFVDPHPLPAGSIGLYEEDALARFGALTVATGAGPV